MGMRVAVALLCLALTGCLDSSSAHAPADTARKHGLAVRRQVDLQLGPGHARAAFVTRYPGGSFTIFMTAPRAARYHVVLNVAGIRADGFPRFQRDACTSHGPQLACRAGPFEAIPKGFGPWRLTVVKTSRPAALIHVRLRFAGSSAGT
jgi:hypothetical protein